MSKQTDLGDPKAGRRLRFTPEQKRRLLDEATAGSALDFGRAGIPIDPGRKCGIVECWFLLVRITMFDGVVIWSDFEQFHRPSVYELGPFVFDRQAYLQQLAGTG